MRDWSSVAGRGRLLLSGSVSHASLKTAVYYWRGGGKLCGRHLWNGPKENLGFCAESEPGVDWDACAGDNGDGTLDLSRCTESGNYTGTCFDSVWDATR